MYRDKSQNPRERMYCYWRVYERLSMVARAPSSIVCNRYSRKNCIYLRARGSDLTEIGAAKSIVISIVVQSQRLLRSSLALIVGPSERSGSKVYIVLFISKFHVHSQAAENWRSRPNSHTQAVDRYQTL